MAGTVGKRIAIVDDDPLFAEHISAMLKHHGGMQSIMAVNGDKLFKLLDEYEVSCVLVDYDLNGETGLALGQAVKKRYFPAPPIIMLTGAGSERTATKAFRIGFSDYVSKRHLDPKELTQAIKVAISTQQEEIALREETERLRAQRRVDSLTGFASSGFVHARLSELAVSKQGKGFTILSIAMRQFDEFRLHFGHSTSERIFRDFANRMNGVDLAGGYLGHLSAHRLGCIFETIVEDDVLNQVAYRLNQAASFEEVIDGTHTQLSPSFGRARFPEHGSDAVETINVSISTAMDAEIDENKSSDSAITLPADGLAGVSPVGDRRQGARGEDGEDRRFEARRKEQRFRVLKRGKIVVKGLNSIVDCVVRNVSESGAQIRVEGYFAPPNRFQLQIIGQQHEPVWVEKRWQVGNDIGVLYQGEDDE